MAVSVGKVELDRSFWACSTEFCFDWIGLS